MAEPTKKKITFQIKINQEGYGLDHRNIQNVEVWVPEDKPDPRVHPKGYVKSELFKEVSSRLTEALDMNASLRSDIAESQARVRFLQARLNKIEDILNPNSF